MTDIVERLRFLGNIPFVGEAADEIERLHKVVDTWADVNAAAGHTLRQQEAEIEKLTEALATCREVREYDRNSIEVQRKAIIELKTEIERLQASLNVHLEAADEIDRLRAEIGRLRGQANYSLEIEALVSHKHKLEAENGRLRAELNEVLGWGTWQGK